MVETARAYDEEARRARAERILDVATELLERWGYKRLTMDDVAAQADIGKGTIYLHWKTREALFEAVVERKIHGMIQELLDHVRADPYNALPHRLGRLYFQMIMRRPLMRAFFTSDLDVLGKLARNQRAQVARLEGLRDQFMDLLAEAGVVRDDVPPHEMAYAFRAVIIGFFLVDPFFQAPQPTVERRAELLEMIIKGAFGLDREPSRESVERIAAHVIRLLSEVSLASTLRDKLFRAPDVRS
jgi:AcrR family transcriptional regulator